MVIKGRGDKSVAFNVSIYGLWGRGRGMFGSVQSALMHVYYVRNSKK